MADKHDHLQFFRYAHLPPELQEVSRPFSLMAHQLVAILPANEMLDRALLKLMEAKDCAVRAKLYSYMGGGSST